MQKHMQKVKQTRMSQNIRFWVNRVDNQQKYQHSRGLSASQVVLPVTLILPTFKLTITITTALALALTLLTLTSCGGGAVSSPVDAPVVVPLTVSPSVIEMSPEIPRTFVVAGGTPTYSIATSNKDVLPVTTISGATFTLVAKAVSTDTPVDITVHDAASTASTSTAAVKVTVKPTVFSVLPSGGVSVSGAAGTVVGQDGSCPTAAVPALVDYYIFGGAEPYSVFSPLTTFAQVAIKGRSFTAKIMSCGKTSFIVTDATGRALETSTIEGVAGDKGSVGTAIFSATPAITVACGQAASVSLTGNGSYSATVTSSTSDSIVVTPSIGALPATVSIGARRGLVNSPETISFKSGNTTVSTLVSVTGTIAGACP